MTEPLFLLIGVTGPSSSGKSTLARLLRQLFPESFILHEDDFYKPEAEIPVVNGLADWDCPEAIDFESLGKAVSYIKYHESLPSDLNSKEEQNSLGSAPITLEEAKQIRQEILGVERAALNIRFCVVDGFLLFNDLDVISNLDIKLLLRAPYERLKARREARNGYATLEGFWQDPPGYFDQYVWPGYVRSHKHFFENEDVEGSLTPDAIAKGINTTSKIDVEMHELLRWALIQIKHALDLKS
ncbi:P-loop containing nucleoside triphosphate hydrolase protein [Lipomyces japonicus]|uniref:P-loop containing nucleoside triphosphate hydrolase protein n=1 Tax=Lipomyces japonicus TaxID=56871 RepID=UPI0034CE64F6